MEADAQFDERVSAMEKEIGELVVKDSKRLAAEAWFRQSFEYLPALKQCLQQKYPNLPQGRLDEIMVTIQELLVNCMYKNQPEEVEIILEHMLGTRGILTKVFERGSPGFDHRPKVERARSNPTGLTRDQVLYRRGSGEPYPGGTGMFCLLNFAQVFEYSKKGDAVAVLFEISSSS